MRPRRRFALSAVAAAVALVAGACARTASGPDGKADAPPPPPPRAPLTGLVVSDRALLERPALAIKVENSSGARPQAGLDRADVVYEQIVEGGITRFVAIFHSRAAARVGPVRSGRFVDPEIATEYGEPLFGFSGAARHVLDHLEDSDLVLLPHGKFGTAYRRDPRKRAPHNLYVATRALYEAAGDDGAPPPEKFFAFGALPPAPAPSQEPGADGSPPASPKPAYPSGALVRVPFSSSAYTAVWRYDPASKRYLRSHGDVAHRVESGKQIAARNVLVLSVEVKPGRFRDSAGNPSPDITVIGSGRAVLLRDGARVEGRWSRATVEERTSLVDSAGRPMTFGNGATWIELAPRDVRISFS